VRNLENSKENLYNITTLTNKTPQEVQEEMRTLYKSLDEVTTGFSEIQEHKETM
jgi:predicted DNA-binding ArsR family transcriptional regulator